MIEKYRLTTEEKLRLLTGINMWQTYDANGKVKSLFLSDGPHGVRAIDERMNTAYPSLSLVGCSFDRGTAEFMGRSIADDAIEQGADILLAPGVNMKRTPLCGRNFEYFSEDPILSGELAYAYINGVQSKGVGTALKHFAANNAEYFRCIQNCEMDDRTLYEIYLTAFEIALKAKPWTVMCSYNMLNGVYMSENRALLKEILRERFGFDGVIMSDWGAVHHGGRALNATLDLRMPDNENAYDELKNALECGRITEKQVDDAVDRILTLIEKTKNNLKKTEFTKLQRHENSKKIAEEGIVLLKNENSILPLNADASIDVYQDQKSAKCVCGGGSAFVKTDYRIRTIGEELENRGFRVKKHAHCRGDIYSDYQIVCIGDFASVECEGQDRANINVDKIDEQILLNVIDSGTNVIVLVFAGSAIDMSRFVDKVKAIVYAGFGGEGITEALADILSGKVCPSGKLAETFPLSLSDVPVNLEEERRGGVFYKERMFIGYRHYEKYRIKPLFAFGYGLSYAKFEYSDLSVKQTGKCEFEISYTVENISDIDGKEISEVYVSDSASICERPVKELKEFSKDFIAARTKKRVTLKLDERAFRFYNPSLKSWYVENGKFVICVGSASDDVRLAQEISICLSDTDRISDFSNFNMEI